MNLQKYDKFRYGIVQFFVGKKRWGGIGELVVRTSKCQTTAACILSFEIPL